MSTNRSTPSFFEFSPFFIPSQAQVIYDMDLKFDYSQGVHELLLSGSVGSSKSVLAAHLGVKHCLMNPGAKLIIARRSLPDIKRTIYQTIREHLECEELKEGIDYFPKDQSAQIKFKNGADIIPIYWSDGRYKRLRSVAASAAIVEELTENDNAEKEAYFELKQRIGRLPHIKESFIVCCTNPDAPSHWAHQYFIASDKIDHPTRHVYYSKTEDNPFLPASYLEQLKRDLDPKMARRMLFGEWIDIDDERIYYAYDPERNYRPKLDYEPIPNHPIILSFDFNIGNGKPMSSVAMQYSPDRDDTFHVFDQVVIHGARTEDVMIEWAHKGVFEKRCPIIIHGDASGSARDTRGTMSDYDIIRRFLRGVPNLSWQLEVGRENPPVRLRHNRVNAYCFNEAQQTRLIVYKNAPTVDEALRMTQLKKGGSYIEDDTKAFQHIGTALGYSIVYETNRVKTYDTSSVRMR